MASSMGHEKSWKMIGNDFGGAKNEIPGSYMIIFKLQSNPY